MLSIEDKVCLEDLQYHSYLDTAGKIDSDFEGKIAIYAIFDQDNQTWLQHMH